MALSNYDAMDRLLGQRDHIESKMTKKQLKGGSHSLFDVSSSDDTGKKSSLRQHA